LLTRSGGYQGKTIGNAFSPRLAGVLNESTLIECQVVSTLDAQLQHDCHRTGGGAESLETG